MRTSILSRSAIAVASLAIGAVTLAAPASAAPAPGVTRDLVLTAAQGFYANQGAQHSPPEAVIQSFERLASLTCDFAVDPDAGRRISSPTYQPFATSTADGILVSVLLSDNAATPSNRVCSFAAIATSNAADTLTGDIAVTAWGDEPLKVTEALSGNVFVTRPINVGLNFGLWSLSLTTSGNAVRTVTGTTTEQVTTPQSKAVRAAAKKKYDRALEAAKKSHTKAVKKAGKSKSKKTAANRAYNRKKLSAKKAYNQAIVKTTTVSKPTVRTESRPFDIFVSTSVEHYAG